MDEKEKERRWKELITNEGIVVSNEKLVRRKERLGWRKELVSDLKLLVMVELVGCGLFVMLELLKY